MNPFRHLLTISLAAAVVALACSLSFAQNAAPTISSTAPATQRITTQPATVPRKRTEQMRGFSMQLFDPSEEGMQKYLGAIDELSAMGCTWINLAVAARQDNVRATAIQFDWVHLPSERDLERLVRHAKSRGMGVMVMPMVLLSNAGPKDWRGVINPTDWNAWFGSYQNFVTKIADIAQAGGADIMCVGSELLSTETFRENWIETIAQIKLRYKGKLTYSANWDHYEAVTFWDQLDYIGMNNYNELAKNPGASVEQLNKNWVPIKDSILAFAAKQKKPFMFTEVGWHNLVNTISQPWNYVAQGAIDLGEQHRAFQSFIQTWQNVPNDQFMGAYVWEWRPGGKPTDHGSYSLQGTPALEVVKNWMIAP